MAPGAAYLAAEAERPGPRCLSHYQHGVGSSFGGSGVAVVGHHAYIATFKALLALDMTDAADVKQAAFLDHKLRCGNDVGCNCAAAGSMLYVAGHKHVIVYDLASPGAPKEVSRFKPGGGDVESSTTVGMTPVGNGFGTYGRGTFGLAASGCTLFVADNHRVVAIDVSDPLRPTKRGEAIPHGVGVTSGKALGGTGLAVASDGGRTTLYAAGPTAIVAIDATDPAAMAVRGEARLGPKLGFATQSVTGVAAAGGLAYVAGPFKLAVLAVSDPAHMRVVGVLTHTAAALKGSPEVGSEYAGAALALDPGGETVHLSQHARLVRVGLGDTVRASDWPVEKKSSGICALM